MTFFVVNLTIPAQGVCKVGKCGKRLDKIKKRPSKSQLNKEFTENYF